MITGGGRKAGAHAVPPLSSWILPKGSYRCPMVTHAIKIGVAVLADDGSHAVRVFQRNAYADRRAVVENVDRVTLEADNVDERTNHFGERGEAIGKQFMLWPITLAKARKIRRHDPKLIAKHRNKIPEHVSR